MRTLKNLVVILVSAAVLGSAFAAPAGAQPVRLKDVARVQGLTSNKLVGYGIVTGLNQTGDSTSAAFTSKTIQNVLQSFGLSTTSQDVRTRDVAAVIVTASLPPFAHSGDTADVTVSAIGDATSLQGGTLVLSELRAANNLVYATAQGPVSVGGFSVGTNFAGPNSITQNHVTAGRIPQGAVIARDMITNIQQDAAGFSYVLTSPDYRTAARLASALNGKFGAGTARALDAETVRVNLPARYTGDPVNFLADAGDVSLQADQVAKVVVNERTGTVVMGGDITLGSCAIAHGNLSITIATNNTVVPAQPFTNGQPPVQSNTQISATEGNKKLVYISGAATLAQVVRALNTIGVSPRDLIAIVQALRESGSLQADVEII
ncbi:MAG: flagellar basal body P-ring protein FlgI [Candidatus Eremiobacteraeota bacterium]|nr:flagellar basal body P-ring protein FlgI [Candidatus Eremiobacteraeota bacterium]